jgi:hypothetical protein
VPPHAELGWPPTTSGRYSRMRSLALTGGALSLLERLEQPRTWSPPAAALALQAVELACLSAACFSSAACPLADNERHIFPLAVE